MGAPKSRSRIGFILREEQLRRALRVKEALAEIALRERDDPAGFILRQLPQGGASDIIAPRPVVAEPEGGQELERRRFRAAVMHGDLNQQSSGAALAYSTKTSK